jgi:hypothetical protein
MPTVKVPVSLEVAPDIESSPERVLIGARDRGSEVMEVVSLRSLSGRPFAIERVEAEGPGVIAVAGADGVSCEVRVRVTEVGPVSGRVRLRVRPNGGESVELDVPVRGHGFSPGQ